ncbi:MULTISPECIES: type VI secretion system ATPase TssH [Pseudomonas]|uniref:ClpV1 family T6SS ATPase n=1 Tax=Pseudomonas oryzihabitans TaxID=47885 RepID=A0A178LH90_9PSED|nr:MULTISPECIES: type VI secretion system ATPase TssH [Pseudomonas]NRH42697.1 type VI secretion system ATPase TssH [Pseudomonas sp. MS15a(2019)]OAN29721.1 ClpV1 family T6SS ATPase [Pseudomonas oryzihabitans]
MLTLDLQHLINTLTDATRQDLEQAAQRCVRRGSRQILIEDLLAVLLESRDGLLDRALKAADIDPADFAATLQPRPGNAEGSDPVFDTELLLWLQDAVLIAQLELERSEVGSVALLLALLRHPERLLGTRYGRLLERVNPAQLLDFVKTQQPLAAAVASASPLSRFTHDLSDQARTGRLDPVLGRDAEIRQLVDILSRRRKNNPLVVGEAGVGKTAIVEGLALRIAAGEVPNSLRQVEIRTLDLGLLQAGASVKGEFERRLQEVIDAVRQAPQPIVLFIDEAHTLIGAGGPAGGSDAANLLKPALARGELRTIAATTWGEYRKYFEKDPALARRFQPVKLEEFDVASAITVLRGLAPTYAESHGVYLRDDAVVAAAELAARYLSGRQLPDKAVDVLDTCCARVRISLASPPPALDALRACLAATERTLAAARRDADHGLLVAADSLDSLTATRDTERLAVEALQANWERQRELAERILTLRTTAASTELAATRAELEQLQRQAGRLVSLEVCPQLVAEVIAAWTGLPVDQLARRHDQRLARFASDLRGRLRGQEQAVVAIDRALRAVAVGLNATEAPVGVFLLVGPSGVGKTETALALAELLYGGERFLTTLNLSEFAEKHSVSRLIGAPPGYVGYGEGGLLTEAVRRQPYSVVLLDEVEKADPEVLNLFYQIFDRGQATDSEGRQIDFRNVLFLLTSNLASSEIQRLCRERRPDASSLAEAIRPILTRHFKPALLARLRVVPYYPLDDDLLRELAVQKLDRVGQRLLARQVAFSYAPALPDDLAARCRDDDSGARRIDLLLEQRVLPLLTDHLLDALATGQPLHRLHLDVNAVGELSCEVTA